MKLWESPLTAADYFVVDMETSGFSAEKDLILSLAAACFTGVDPQFTETMYELIRHEHLEGVPQAVWNLTGLSPEQVRAGRDLEQVLRRVLTLSVNRVWIAHHARHELSFLGRQARLLWKLKLRPIVVDTAVVAQALGRMTRVPTLDEVCAWLNVDVRDRHRADADVRMTAEVWRKEIALCQRIGLRTIAEVMDWTSSRAY
ncbi:hypothetical protein GCM10025857_12380 [Alicyclobacillus contaminans]|nr:hypothetical protein GCM10025857_12380 [Alicyclobacillus contaminans]